MPKLDFCSLIPLIFYYPWCFINLDVSTDDLACSSLILVDYLEKIKMRCSTFNLKWAMFVSSIRLNSTVDIRLPFFVDLPFHQHQLYLPLIAGSPPPSPPMSQVLKRSILPSSPAMRPQHVVKHNKLCFVKKLQTLLVSKSHHCLPLCILKKCRS